MSTRPPIPVDVSRDILFEARHRCAVCCDPLPLERAHIVPWHRTQDHSRDNLIALCANCHTRADYEQWGEAILRKYKKNPCALATNTFPALTPEQKALVDMIVNLDPDAITPRQQGRIVSMVAAYVGFPLAAIRIESIAETNSSRIQLSLPRGAAQRLVDGWSSRDRLLIGLLDEIPVSRIEESAPLASPSAAESPPRTAVTPSVSSTNIDGRQTKAAVMSRIGKVDVCTFYGTVGIDEEALERTGKALQALIDAAERPALLIDLAQTIHLSSAALGMLLSVQRMVAAKRGQLRLAGVNDSLMEVFKITRMDRIFAIHTDREAAIRSFA